MVAPAYTDIAHFRAPYKNWPHLGVGAAVPATPASVDPLAAVVVQEKETGIRVFQPQVASAVMKMLEGMSVIFLTPDAVKLDIVAPGDVREKASAWVTRKLAEGKSVVAGSFAGLTAFVSPIAVERTLEAVVGTAGEKEKASGGAPITAVLARPLKRAMAFGPFGIAAVALVGVGLVAYLATRKRRK